MKGFFVLFKILAACGSFREGALLCAALAECKERGVWRPRYTVLGSGAHRGVLRLVRAGWLKRIGRNTYVIDAEMVARHIGGHWFIPEDAHAETKPEAKTQADAATQDSDDPPESLATTIRVMIDVWRSKLGGIAPASRIGRVAKKLATMYSEEEIIMGWKKYMESEDWRYVSPDRFAQCAGAWIDTSSKIVETSNDELQKRLELEGVE